MRASALFLIAVVVAAAATPRRASADEDFSIVINGQSGAALLRNDANTTVQLDGYLLRSPSVDVFNPATWNSLDDNPATPGWSESFAAGNRLGEANLFGSTALAPGGTLSIGSPYIPFDPAAFGDPEPGLDTIEFTYSTLTSGAALVGDVEFISRNTIVLVVDPNTGAASLQNQSEFNVNIDSYLIKSLPAVLDAAGWTPLADSLGGAGGWTASTGFANRIGEGNLFGSTFLAANGGSLSLGAPIDPGMLNDETDLSLEFTIAGLDTILGGVLFAAAPSEVPGDYNGDGTVNAADYTVWRDHSGQTFQLTNEVAGVTPGVVTTEDYNAWKSRFGNTGGAGAGGGAGIVALSVPEPATSGLAGLLGLALAVRRGRKH
jgi:hypothetical protein